MKSLLRGLLDTHGRLYIAVLYNTPFTSSFSGFHHLVSVSATPVLGRNEL